MKITKHIEYELTEDRIDSSDAVRICWTVMNDCCRSNDVLAIRLLLDSMSGGEHDMLQFFVEQQGGIDEQGKVFPWVVRLAEDTYIDMSHCWDEERNWIAEKTLCK